MNDPVALRRRTRRLLRALMLAVLAAPGWTAAAPPPVQAGPEIAFQPGTAKARAMFARSPVLRELVDEPFEMAGIDLNGDGRKEVILRATSSMNCGSAGCAVVVLEQRGQQVVQLFHRTLSGRLAVTREHIGAYLGLAIVDDTGAVVVANRPGTPMHGKPMVYPVGKAR